MGRQLYANPQVQYAFDVRGAPRLAAPELAVRTSCVIVTSELHLPRDKFDPGLFFEILEKPQ